MDIEKAKGTCKAYINAIDTFGTIDYKCINNLYEPIETVLSELEKKDKRLNRQFKLLQKKDKKIEELKADNSHQWEERCKLTFELEKKDEYIKMLTDERDTLIQERDYYKARYNEFNEAFIKMKS